MEQKNTQICIWIFIILAMLIPLSNASGVATPYWDGNPLKLAPGESKIVSLALQNMVGDEDITLKAELLNDGGGIATLLEDDLIYFVPFGENNVPVNIKIDVPENIEIGGVRDIVLAFSQVSGDEEGMVQLVSGFTTKFPVNVVIPEESELYKVEPEEPTSNKFLILVFVILFIVALIIYLLKKRKNKEK